MLRHFDKRSVHRLLTLILVLQLSNRGKIGKTGKNGKWYDPYVEQKMMLADNKLEYELIATGYLYLIDSGYLRLA